MSQKEKNQQVRDAQDYPGVQPDIADDNKVTPEMVKEETKDLNNNPRNNGKII